MTAIQRMLTALSLACALSACGPSADQPSADQSPELPPVEDTAFGDMVGTMDKARAVEDTTMAHKEELDRALQEAEGDH